MASVRSRGWCVTINLPNTDAYGVILSHDQVITGWEQKYDEEFRRASWSCRQLEVAPTTGKFHIQGCLYFSSARSFNVLRSRLPGAHLEVMKGSCAQNKDYCSKEETRAKWSSGASTHFIEYGQMPLQGKRSDLDAVVEQLADGQSLRDVALANPTTFIRYANGIQKLSTLYVKERLHMTELEIWWGPTGSGKSTGIRDHLKSLGVSQYFQLAKGMVSGSVVWFDGYIPQVHEYMVIDDFYGWLPLHFFLNMIDSHPLQVQFKGGSIQFRVKKVFMTSNKDPREWYDRETAGESVYAAYLRRLMHQWSTIKFHGYGPDFSLSHCPCVNPKCTNEHAAKSSSSAFASGYRAKGQI